MTTYTVAIIGAGVVGCATASALAEICPTIVLEKNCAPGLETSRFNSGVIHSGIHLPPTFAKAQLARQGSALAQEFCTVHHVPLRRVGMHIVVAPHDLLGLWPETRNLFRMLRRATSQGISVQLVSSRAVRRREMHVRCLFGLHIPEVSIVDPMAYCRALALQAALHGAHFHFNQEVVAIRREGGRWVITTTADEFAAANIVNVAGLSADRVAGLAGYAYRQVYYRGEYYEVDQAASGLSVKGLVYPVHQPGKPGLGVHLTPTIDGRFLLGPNARPVADPTDYQSDPTPAEDFWRDVHSFVPDLKVEHLRWAFSGIRPKLTATRSENDFIIVREHGAPCIINCLGIESPGLTASLAIAARIATLLADRTVQVQTTHA